jgi:hypothetical protein
MRPVCFISRPLSVRIAITVFLWSIHWPTSFFIVLSFSY